MCLWVGASKGTPLSRCGLVTIPEASGRLMQPLSGGGAMGIKRKAEKSCPERAKGSCGVSRCARLLCSGGIKPCEARFISLYKNATLIPAAEAATAQKSRGRRDANVVGALTSPSHSEGSRSV